MPIYFDSEDGMDARDALLAAVPDAERRFDRCCKSLKKLLDDVNKHFPGAHYFVCSDNLGLDLWYPEHDTTLERNKTRALSDKYNLDISGGDY